MAVHTDPAVSEREVIEGVHLSTERDHLEELITSYDGPLRVFTGYSGWGSGQLEGEMELGGWLTLPAEEELVFADDQSMWKLVTEKIGFSVLKDMINPVAVPDDPSMN
jgi:putative transcriptional regulator